MKNKKVFASDPELGRRTCFGNVTRVLAKDATSTYAQVDCNEDNQPDGWTPLIALSGTFSKRPEWVSDRDKRLKTLRAATTCDR